MTQLAACGMGLKENAGRRGASHSNHLASGCWQHASMPCKQDSCRHNCRMHVWLADGLEDEQMHRAAAAVSQIGVLNCVLSPLYVVSCYRKLLDYCGAPWFVANGCCCLVCSH